LFAYSTKKKKLCAKFEVCKSILEFMPKTSTFGPSLPSKSFISEEVRLLIVKVILKLTLFYGVDIFGDCDARDIRTVALAFNLIIRYDVLPMYHN